MAGGLTIARDGSSSPVRRGYGAWRQPSRWVTEAMWWVRSDQARGVPLLQKETKNNVVR
jgi:2-polyprenyl-6-methoxyphenol hydroxylase-like FAD-dependent oxidoreductase